MRTHTFPATIHVLGRDVQVEVMADMSHVERATCTDGHYYDRPTLERLGELDRLEDTACDHWQAGRRAREDWEERDAEAHYAEARQRLGEMRG